MAVSNSNTRSHLKRSLSLSLDVGLNTDQPGESFNSTMSRKTRRRANKKAKETDLSNIDASMNSSHESMTQHDAPDNVTTGSNCSQCSLNERIIKSLKAEVNELSQTVKSLTAQMQMLTAALGFDTASVTSAAPQQSLSQTSDTATQANTESVRTSYATVAKSGMAQQMHCNIVSAVYMDLEQKKKRANNVVISGLVTNENFDDKAVITGMIYQEFGREITVKHCRRLGRKIDGKTQNILVSLSSADEASYLISNARHLRRSNNEFVRQNVYINADLTPAEAKASYELRRARRQRATVSQARERSSVGNPSSQEVNGATRGDPTSLLNPSAPVFTSVPANDISNV